MYLAFSAAVAWFDEDGLLSITVYLSGERLFPVEVLVWTSLKFIPSSDNDIIKSYDRSFPLYHAISTKQTALLLPRSTNIHDPTLLCDHLVCRLLSKAFCGTASSPSSPIAENRDIGRFSLQELAEDK